MKKLVAIVVAVALAVSATSSFWWYRYVTNVTELYDEVGITLNSNMPEPLRAWGCEQLHRSFPNSVPPLGCATGDGTQWK